jgi:hypothetical protein
MTGAVPRSVVEAYDKADAEAGFLDDDVQGTIGGPVDLPPFCGTRRGKAAVLDLIQRRVPEVFTIFSLAPEAMPIDGGRVATLNRLTATGVADGQYGPVCELVAL